MRLCARSRSIPSILGFSGLITPLLCLLLTACAPKVSPVDLPYQLPAEFSETGSSEIPDKWWNAFKDPILDSLIDVALRENLSLLTVWNQLQSARAFARIAGAPLKPTVDLQLQSGISRPVPDFVGGENTQLSLRSSYEVDLWGRIRYGQHASQFRSEATYYDYKTAAVSLSGEITLAWFRLKATHHLLRLVEEQIRTNEQVLALIRARFAGGQVRGVDILRQEQLIETSNAQKLSLEMQAGILQNQLSVLLGIPPDQYMEDVPTEWPVIPALPVTGIPLQLVNRRPDIQGAFYRLQAADRELAAAISAKYPRLSFSLTAAIRSNTFDDLLQSQAAQLTGGLLMPLFYGGRLKATVDQTEAARQQQLYTYGQTVLSAFQEVENALIQETKQTDRIEVIERQVELAQRTNGQLRIEYLNGSIPYLDVLVSLNQEQQLRRDLVAAKLTLIEFRVALYRSLAGGFPTARETRSDDS